MKLEHQIAVALMHWWAFEAKLHALDERLLFAIPNAGGYVGGFRSNMMRVVSMKREGVRPGVSDYFLAVPNDSYNGLFLELKSPTGVVSKEQRAFGELVGRTGYAFAVARGVEEASKVIDSYLTARGEYRIGGTDGDR